MLCTYFKTSYNLHRTHDAKCMSQVRSREALHDKLLQAGKHDVDGVLLLSGSHPANKLAGYIGYRSPKSSAASYVVFQRLANVMYSELKVTNSFTRSISILIAMRPSNLRVLLL